MLVLGDIGIDDTMAIIYGYFNDDIDIVGIVADYGNVTKNKAVASVQYLKSILENEKVEQVSIIGGAELSMTGETLMSFPEIHGEYGLGPIIPPDPFTNGNALENFFEVVQLIEKYDDLIIVNIGRLTSLATMFLLYPQLMEKVKAYYIMGGAFWVPGNITAVSEANFYGDPIAAKIVLSKAENVSIIPLNVTEYAIVTPEMVNYIDKVQDIKIIKPMIDFYYAFYKHRNPSLQGAPLHDVLTLMAPFNENMLTYYELPVYMVQSLNGIERGQSIADIRPFVELEELEDGLSEPVKKHRIAFQLNYEEFFIDFMTVLTGQRFG